jgi:hypothetical protein
MTNSPQWTSQGVVNGGPPPAGTVASAPVRFRESTRGQSKELTPLVAGAESQSLAALVHLQSGKTLTLGNRSVAAEHGIDIALLPALARVLLRQADEEDATHVKSICAEAGGVQSVALLMDDCDLLFSRLPFSKEVLCLAIRHGTGTAASFDSIVHARAVLARLVQDRKKRAMGSRAPAQAEQSGSAWKGLLAAFGARWRKREAAATAIGAEPSASGSFSGLLRNICDADEHVMAADWFDLGNLSHVDSYRPRQQGLAPLRPEPFAQVLKAFFNGQLALAPMLAPYGLASAPAGKIQIQMGVRDIYLLHIPFFPALRIPFEEAQVLMLVKPPRANPALDWAALDRVGLNLLRLRIGALLSGGMKTQMLPFPQTQREFQEIVDRLADLPEQDLAGRLDIGGFAAHPVMIDNLEQRCAECIYYLPHRKWCDLPQLPVPVEAHWWCRLWKL